MNETIRCIFAILILFMNSSCSEIFGTYDSIIDVNSYEYIGHPVISEIIVGSRELTLEWEELFDASGYYVYFDKGTTVTRDTGVKIKTTETSYTVKGLENHTDYAFAVSAIPKGYDNKETMLSDVVIANPTRKWKEIFSDNGILACDIDIVNGANNELYFVYGKYVSNWPDPYELVIKKYNNGVITDLGNPYSSLVGDVGTFSLAIDSLGSLYLFSVGYNGSNAGFVSKYNNGSWEKLEGTILGDNCTNPFIVIDAKDNIYISCYDVNQEITTVFRYNESNWVPVGSSFYDKFEKMFINSKNERFCRLQVIQ